MAAIWEVKQYVEYLFLSLFFPNMKEELSEAKKTVQELSDITKGPSIKGIEVPEGVERDNGLKDIFNEIIIKNYLTWRKKEETKYRKSKEPPKDPIRNDPCHGTS